MKRLSTVFWAAAVALSDVMCAVVAYRYCDMEWGIRVAGYSAPAQTALLTGIPYAVGIAVCVVLAVFFGKRSRMTPEAA